MVVKRLVLPDVLKGVAVLLMIQVHLTELFATELFYSSLPGKISLFLGAVPAAPLFMAVMGFFFALFPRGTRYYIKRGAGLIAAGFLLNLGINLRLFAKIISGDLQLSPLPYIFGVDILFLAGLSLVFLALIAPLAGKRPHIFLFIALAVSSMPFVLPVYDGNNVILTYLLAYLHSHEWWSYFPLFPWLAYPLTGAAAGLLYQSGPAEFADSVKKSWVLWASAAVFLVLSWYGFGVSIRLEDYYHHSALFYGWAIAFMVLIALLFEKLVSFAGSESAIIRYFAWTGKNVTSFYVFQWLIIGNLATSLYKSVETYKLIFWFAAIVLISSVLVWLWNKKHHWRRIFENH